MKKIVTILLGLAGLSMLIGLSACRSITLSGTTDPEQVAGVASEIADFDLPAGYHPDFSTHVMGYTVAAYSRGAGPSHLYLIQSEVEVVGGKLADALDELVVGSGEPHTLMTVVDTRIVMVRGQETKIVISDYKNSEGRSYRQATVAFRGNGGPALLVFSESIENWDQATLDALISSIQ